MKKLNAILAVVAALAATLAGLDLTGIIAVMPPDVAKVLVVVPSAAAVVVHAINAFRKALDENGKVQCSPLAVLVAVVLVVLCLCPGCADLKLAGLSVETPYGTVTSDKGGSVVVTVRPIVIDEK